MKKKILLIIAPFKFTKFYTSRYELPFLEKEFNIDIKIHQLIDYAHPQYKKAFMHDEENIYEVQNYKNFKTWKKSIFELVKNNSSNITILSDIDNRNFKELKINFILKKLDIPIIQFKSPSSPQVKDKNLTSNFFHKFKRMLKFPKNAVFYFIYNINKFLENYFNLLPTHIIKAGSTNQYISRDQSDSLSKIYLKKKVEVIEGNSYDYSNYLVANKKNEYKKTNKICIFLDSSSPKFEGDSLLVGQQHIRTAEKWFPSVVKFFDNLENLLQAKVLIAPHPKTKHIKFPSYFGGREMSDKRLSEISSLGDIFITVESTAASLSVIHKKPILLLYSDEIKKSEVYMSNLNYFASELGTTLINVDDPFDKNQILQNLKINEKKYESYKLKYISTLKSNIPNYKILGNLIESLIK